MTQSFDEWLHPGAIQLPTKIGDMGFDHVGVVLPSEVVQVFQQFSLGHDRARTMNKILQDSIFSWREVDQLSVAYERFDARCRVPHLTV